MNQQSSKKRTIISFSIAVATALLAIYIQNYNSKDVKKQTFEANATNHDISNFIELIH